ncbi:MAG: hypothetical protein OEZ02_07525 [Anaerolineae bacterium]|nr:hypothetical protein [Anaerolineae bacterium]
MELLGIGIPELIFLFIIILIVLGPDEMAKTGAILGKFFRDVRMSPYWKALTQTSRAIRSLPNELARQANLDDLKKELQDMPRLNDQRLFAPEDPGMDAWTILPPEASKASEQDEEAATQSATPPATPQKTED